jgi:hypothetical protein
MKLLKPFLFAFLIFLIITVLINLFTASLLFDDWKYEWKEDKENQILFANTDQSDGWNGATLELLNNNNFRYGDFSGYKEGVFTINKDTIILDKALIGGFKAVLRYDTFAIVNDTFLIVLDKTDKLQKENRYRVHKNTNKTGISIPILKKSE